MNQPWMCKSSATHLARFCTPWSCLVSLCSTQPRFGNRALMETVDAAVPGNAAVWASQPASFAWCRQIIGELLIEEVSVPCSIHHCICSRDHCISRTEEFSFAVFSSPTAVWSDPICFVPGRVNLNGCRSSFHLSVALSTFLPSYPHLLTL